MTLILWIRSGEYFHRKVATYNANTGYEWFRKEYKDALEEFCVKYNTCTEKYSAIMATPIDDFLIIKLTEPDAVSCLL